MKIMGMSHEEIYAKVRQVMVDALGVDPEEVTPKAKLREDLGAESIDFLDIVFRLEKAFTTDPAKPFKIPRGELFPDDLPALMNDPQYVTDGKITPQGVAEMKKRMPFSDFTEFDKDPSIESAESLLTVETIVKYMQTKVG
jgi:acyl carrier protein